MISLGGHDWNDETTVVVCSHVYHGSEVRTVHVDPDALCFQCGSHDDDIASAKVVCLDCVIDRPGLHDVPFVPVNFVAHREDDGSWSVEEQAED